MTQTQARSSVVTVKELLEAGVHFGHQTRRWNPKMRRFIFGERNGIYILDLKSTLKGIEKSYTYVRDLVADGGTVMFVSTKRQMTDAVREAAESCGMPYVNFRWLGGMLTNFQTIKGRIDYLLELEEMEASGTMDLLPKKEALRLRREMAKLDRHLGGMKQLTRVPDAIFVIDTRKEHIAVTEARKKGVAVVATLDTNCDPDEVDYGIPSNDDAIRAGVLMCRIISDAVDEGRLINERHGGSGKRRRRDPEAELLRRQAEIDAKAYEEERARQEAEEIASSPDDVEPSAPVAADATAGTEQRPSRQAEAVLEDAVEAVETAVEAEAPES